MPGPRRNLDEYVADRLQQLADLGGVLVAANTSETDGDALIMATVRFGEGEDGADLLVYEHLRMDGGQPHRFKYSYHAQSGTDFLFRYDRDPIVHPVMGDHKHIGHRRFPSGRITLHDVVEELWDVVAERRDAVEDAT